MNEQPTILAAVPADVRDDLTDRACRRLRPLVRKMLGRLPGPAGRDPVEPVLAQLADRLRAHLRALPPADLAEHVRVSGMYVRRVVAEAVGLYPPAPGRDPQAPTQEHDPHETRPDPSAPGPPADDPARWAAWLTFHRAVEQLPAEDRQAFDVLWYHDVPLGEAAELLGLSAPALRRRWLAARLHLSDLLRGQLPPE